MSAALAKHIEDLRIGWETTNRAEDRPIFESLLAQMAIIFAKTTLGAPDRELFEAIDTYERLWGNSFVTCWNPNNPESYEIFKDQVGYPGYPAT